MDSNIFNFPRTKDDARSSSGINTKTKSSVVNLGMYKLKKSLQKEGFEIVEDNNGKITLVVRVSK